MSINALEALKVWQDGFASENSDSLSKIITDDFIFVGQTTGTRIREETLDWVSSTPDLKSDNLEVMYENGEVMVCLHNMERAGVKGTVMAFARIEGGKLSYWTVVRGDIPN